MQSTKVKPLLLKLTVCIALSYIAGSTIAEFVVAEDYHDARHKVKQAEVTSDLQTDEDVMNKPRK